MSEEKRAALEAKLEAMEKRLQRREDELDVRKLQFLYGYLIDKCMYDQVIELFTDDCEVRFFGGVWKGKEGARRLYYAETDDGEIVGEAARRLVELLFRYLIDCICAALNPPCQPCEDSAVKLACLTVENCEVTRICNLERTFVLSGPAMRYWLPFLHTIGELFEKFCCETVVRFPRRDPDPQPEPQRPVILRAQDQMRRTTPAYSRIEGTPQLQALYRLANLDAETVKTAVNLGGGLTGLAALGGNFSAVPFDFDLPAFNKRIDDAAVGFMDRSQIKESMLRDVRGDLAAMKDEITAAGAGNVEALVNRQMNARLDEARTVIEKRLSDADAATGKLRSMLADQQKRNDALERRLAKLEKGG